MALEKASRAHFYSSLRRLLRKHATRESRVSGAFEDAEGVHGRREMDLKSDEMPTVAAGLYRLACDSQLDVVESGG